MEIIQPSATFMVLILLFSCTREKNEDVPGNLDMKASSVDSLDDSMSKPARYEDETEDDNVGIVDDESITPCFSKQGDQGLCNKWFERLYPYSELEFVDDSVLKICNQIVDTLCYYGCSDYITGENENKYVEFSLTGLYGKICQKSNSAKGVEFFVKYLLRNDNSAEEQLSFSFENIFVNRPSFVLEQIHRQDKSKQEYLLMHLAWGFLNDRYYGGTGTVSSDSSKAKRDDENQPNAVLNLSNYREIFFSLNPELRRLYGAYSDLIDYVLSAVEEELEATE